MNTSTDRIERQIHIKAPRSRVWRALSVAEEFGKWFGARLEGQNFAPGERLEAFRMNSGGWEAQLDSIERHVTKS